MRGCIAGSVYNAEGRIDEFVVIQIKAPPEIGGQNEEKHDRDVEMSCHQFDLMAGLVLP